MTSNIQQWEYLVVNATGDWRLNKWEGEKIELVDYLKQKGLEGWELVQAPSYQYQQCIFKRPKHTT